MERTTQNITLTIAHDMPSEQWERLVLVYESMPGWRGSDKDGCPIWRPDGAEGGEISASVEPSGLVFSGDVSESSWGSWLQEFILKSNDALAFEVKDTDA